MDKIENLDSRMFLGLGWFGEQRILVTKYKPSGKVFAHWPVEERLWKGMKRSKSRGRYWHRYVKPEVTDSLELRGRVLKDVEAEFAKPRPRRGRPAARRKDAA